MITAELFDKIESQNMALRFTSFTSKLFKQLGSVRYSSASSFVKVVEVGPRDGLQNEPSQVPANIKIDFINRLSECGLQVIEVTSFVSPKWVPQMGDNAEVFRGIEKHPGVNYPVLIPNLQGLEAAMQVGVKEIAVFASASDGFSLKNVNCTAEESLNRIKTVISVALKNNLKIRGYISCVVGCPYDGVVKPLQVAKITAGLLDLGCYEISLGDTIGVGNKKTVEAMFKELSSVTTPDKLAIHCHDTYGQALVNIQTALNFGITVVDSSVSGLGGCPYAKGASGNVATEDLIYMLHGQGLSTNVDLKKLISVGRFISDYINKSTGSKVNKALYQNLN